MAVKWKKIAYDERLTDAVTPEQYGAVGNGTTNDYAAIKAAIDTGKTVLFSAKTYAIATPIYSATPLLLRGETGARIKLLFNLPAKDYVVGLDGSGGSPAWMYESRIENLILDADGKGADGLYLKAVVSGVFNDIRVTNTTVSGVHLCWAQLCEFKNFTCSDNIELFTTTPVNGILADTASCSGNIFTNPIIEHVSGSGFKLLSLVNSLIENGTSEGNDIGIELGEASSSLTCMGNTIVGMDMEVNATADIVCRATSYCNDFYGLKCGYSGPPVPVPVPVLLYGSCQNLFSGGITGGFTFDSSSNFNRVENVKLLTAASTITDNGLMNSYSSTYNISDTVIVPEKTYRRRTNFVVDDITAVGTITLTGLPTATQTITVGSESWTFVAARSGANEITIGGTAAETATNIVAALTLDTSEVTSATIGAAVLVASVALGAAGNAVDFSETASNLTMDGSGHLGGTRSGIYGDVVIDCATASYAVVSSVYNTCTIGAPINPVDGMELDITIHNYTPTSGALAVTWNAIFEVPDWVNPPPAAPPGKACSIRFRYDTVWAKWWQVGHEFGTAAQAFQVGGVYINVTGVNPATELGYGTWSRIAEGQMLIGQKSADADFDTAEETGGAKTATVGDHSAHTHSYSDIVNHTHPVNITDSGHTHVPNWLSNTGGSLRGLATNQTRQVVEAVTDNPTASSTTGITATTSNPSGGGASGTTGNPSATLTHAAVSVMNPYFVVYMWKRTA
jgi:hypothetical protein